VLVPNGNVVGLGSAIFAFLAAGTFKTVEEAQARVCPEHQTFAPDPEAQQVYAKLYPLFRDLYFAFGEPGRGPFSHVLPDLIRVAEAAGKAAVPANAD